MTSRFSGRPAATNRCSRRRVRLWYVGMCLVVLLGVGIVSWDRYSAPPEAVKDCSVHARPVTGAPIVPVVGEAPPGWLSQRGGTVNDAAAWIARRSTEWSGPVPRARFVRRSPSRARRA